MNTNFISSYMSRNELALQVYVIFVDSKSKAISIILNETF